MTDVNEEGKEQSAESLDDENSSVCSAVPSANEKFDGIDDLKFVSSVEVIKNGDVIKIADFDESGEIYSENFLQDGAGFSTGTAEIKRKRGRPKLTEKQKAAVQAKRDAGKTKRFSVGEEPNKRVTN